MGKRRESDSGKGKGKTRLKYRESDSTWSRESIRDSNANSRNTSTLVQPGPLASTSRLNVDMGSSSLQMPASPRQHQRASTASGREEDGSSDSEEEITRTLNASLPIAPERPSVILMREGENGRTWAVQSERVSAEDEQRRRHMSQIERSRIDIWDGIPDPSMDSESLPAFSPALEAAPPQARRRMEIATGEYEEAVIPIPSSPPPTFRSRPPSPILSQFPSVESDFSANNQLREESGQSSEDEADDAAPSDPLSIAWEEDRRSGAFTDSERIARDRDRRLAAFLLSTSSKVQRSPVPPSKERTVAPDSTPEIPEDDPAALPSPDKQPTHSSSNNPATALANSDVSVSPLANAIAPMVEDHATPLPVSKSEEEDGQAIREVFLEHLTELSSIPPPPTSASPVRESVELAPALSPSPPTTAVAESPMIIASRLSSSTADHNNIPKTPTGTIDTDVSTTGASLAQGSLTPTAAPSWRTASVLLGAPSRQTVTEDSRSTQMSPLAALEARLAKQAALFSLDEASSSSRNEGTLPEVPPTRSETIHTPLFEQANLKRTRRPPPIPPSRRRLPPEDVQEGLRRLRSNRDSRVNRIRSIYEQPHIVNPSILTYISSDEKAKLQDPLEPAQELHRTPTTKELASGRSVKALISQFEPTRPLSTSTSALGGISEGNAVPIVAPETPFPVVQASSELIQPSTSEHRTDSFASVEPQPPPLPPRPRSREVSSEPSPALCTTAGEALERATEVPLFGSSWTLLQHQPSTPLPTSVPAVIDGSKAGPSETALFGSTQSLQQPAVTRPILSASSSFTVNPSSQPSSRRGSEHEDRRVLRGEIQLETEKSSQPSSSLQTSSDRFPVDQLDALSMTPMPSHGNQEGVSYIGSKQMQEGEQLVDLPPHLPPALERSTTPSSSIPPPIPRNASPPGESSTRPPRQDSFEITELDVLLSGLDEENQGENYDVGISLSCHAELNLCCSNF
ncbi:hypothetical protein BT69DRAFT_1136803 [Atractiella rhizophila]|nr:hypothetical protein BT69DRAFT_1136803 [Atractiella rhizophila]